MRSRVKLRLLFCGAPCRGDPVRSPANLGRFLSSAVASSIFYTPQAGGALTFGLLRFPKSLIGLERRAILTAAPSSPRFIRHWRRFGDDAIVAKVSKSTLLVRRKIKGPPKSPIGFLGKRKHNGAMSFFRVSEKTISGVRADEVAVNFSACTLL